MSHVKISVILYMFVVSTTNVTSINGEPLMPKINNGDELISSIAKNCFSELVFDCINQKVLDFVSSVADVPSQDLRSYKNIDEVIASRIGRILATNEITVMLPQSLFGRAALIYRPDIGLDLKILGNQGRGILLKKKLLLPILLLLKLKIKALMPVFVALIGFKATKALILSKIAIKLVIGFLIYQLIQKLGGIKMSMMPMIPMSSTEPPMSVYGAPVASTPASSYEPSNWEPTGGPYSRVWDSSHDELAGKLAYNSYLTNTNGISIAAPQAT